MNQVMPWQELCRLVEPFYPKREGPGRRPKPLLWMLKLYFLQIWYSLSDPQTEELMHDSHAVQQFLGRVTAEPVDGQFGASPVLNWYQASQKGG